MTKRIRLLIVSAVFISAAAPILQTAAIPLTQLGAEPYEVLQGPFDELNLPFQLQPNAEIQEGSSLSLSLQTSFSSFLPAQGELVQPALIAGNLAVTIDGHVARREVLNQNGAVLLTIPLSPQLFDTNTAEHTLGIAWDASASCDQNLSTTILIQPDSALTLNSIETTALVPDLSLLPFPFFTTSALEAPGTLVVLPDNPSETQLQAAINIAAGLGRKTTDSISLLTEGDLTSAQRGAHNLIFVGPISAFPPFEGVILPHETSGQLNGDPPALGFVEQVASPWNPGLGLLVVSGFSDGAVLNAARAASEGLLVLNAEKNLAIIEGEPAVITPADASGSTFGQLGQVDATFSRYGRSEFSIPFYVQPDRAISAQSYLDFRFGHSRLIDYLRSGLSLSLNGLPLTTIRLSDQTAPRHSEVVFLSPQALRPGWNEIEVTVDILPLDLCAGQEEGQQWLTVYSDSALNLPTDNAGVTAARGTGFGSLLSLLSENMQRTTLILPNDPMAWNAAATLLRGLGDQTWPLLPEIKYTQNAVADTENMLIVASFDGYANLPYVDTGFLEAATPGRGLVSLSSGTQYRYGPGIPLAVLAAPGITSGTPSLVLLADSAQDFQPAIDLLLAPTFLQQYSNDRLLIMQGETVIRDQTAETPTVNEQLGDLPVEQSAQVTDGKGAYLYLILVALVVGLGVTLWEQVSQRIKRRMKRK